MQDRCPICPSKFHCIPGDGPSPCRAMCIGQNPGKREEESAVRNGVGMVFTGDSGREYSDNYLSLAGLSRYLDVYTTNAVKCHTENDRKPTPKEVASCANHFLPREIEEHDPGIIVLLGGVAASLVPSLDLATHHGIPRKVELFGKQHWVYCTMHPAAGLHQTSMMTQLLEDFSNLRRVLGGNYSGPVDEYPGAIYRDLTGQPQLVESILLDALKKPDPWIAVDTETVENRFWCLTFSVDHGAGYMIRATDTQSLAVIARYIQRFLAILHNELYDLDILEQVGIIVGMSVDTMRLAYHLADNYRLGLKPLAYRLCGMVMDDYSDVVMPYSRNAVIEWLEEAYYISGDTPGVKVTVKKRKIPKTKKALEKLATEIPLDKCRSVEGYYCYDVEEPTDSQLTKKILHIIKHTSKTVPVDGKPYSPWKAWQEQVLAGLGGEVAHPVVSRLGSMPIASIEHVYRKDPQVALTYAAKDADSTGRIYPKLLARRAKYEGVVAAGDIDR